MTFADLPNGASVFLDANVLVYHFTKQLQHGQACTDLLERIEQRELFAFCAGHVIGEVAHRLMTIEVSQRFGRPFAGIVRWMTQHPAEIQQLVDFRQALQETSRYGIQLLPTSFNETDSAAAITQASGLLHNDALIVALMQTHNLTNLASNDPDFDRVSGIKRFAPA